MSSVTMSNMTACARSLMRDANIEAIGLRHEYVGTEHILLALCRFPSIIPQLILSNYDLISEVMKRLTPGVAEPSGTLPLTPRARRVLHFAEMEADNTPLKAITTSHILLALAIVQEGVAWEALMAFRLTPNVIRSDLAFLLSEGA